MDENKNPDINNEPEPETGWNYAPESETGFSEQQSYETVPLESVSWTASEYIAHDKTPLWYITTFGLVSVFAVAIFIFSGAVFSPILVIIAGIIFMIAASRKPKELIYSIDNEGLHIGSKTYGYSQFKSFALVEEGPILTIVFIPLQRFMPTLTVYFDPNDQEKIVNALSSYLPIENRKLDFIDNLMRKIRF